MAVFIGMVVSAVGIVLDPAVLNGGATTIGPVNPPAWNVSQRTAGELDLTTVSHVTGTYGRGGPWGLLSSVLHS